ncbi:MAG: 50S ribosomal protein L35 [Planctomycetota bacterium]|jgi:large subunit ribosomal protein L35|nr:50S ribosomal protein L35 [Planctomycetota bacterium]MDA1163298.1 50S ribosomal protein L35 [Planctomycetota bacterium]
MPKQKTHKGIKKRFRVTASGKSTKRSCNRGHILSKKSGKRKRSLRKGSLITGAEARHIVDALRPCS